MRKENARLFCRLRIARRMRKFWRWTKFRSANGCGRKVLLRTAFLVLRLRNARRLRLETRRCFRLGGTFLFLLARPKIGRRISAVHHFSRRQRAFRQFSARKNQGKTRLKTVVIEIVPNEKGVDVIYLNTETNEIRGLHAEKRFSPRRFLRRNM